MKFLVFLAALIMPLMGPCASAAISDDEVRLMREQLQALSQRLDKLEQSNAELKLANTALVHSNAETTSAIAQASEHTDAVEKQLVQETIADTWTDKVKIKGDFRYRMENIDQEGTDERSRQRIRARATVIAQATNDVEIGLGFASGGEDPVSSNQTLGGGGSTKDMNLDLAYFDWTGLNNTHVTAGKFKNFLVRPGKNALLWDGDWRPEGIGAYWGGDVFFANFMGTWVESDSNNINTEFSYILQGGIKMALGDTHLTAGLGYTDIDSQGKGSFFGDDDDFFGNSFDPESKTYLYNYEVFEAFADLSFELFGRGASVFVDVIQNQDAPEFENGYAFGANFGSAKDAGTWQLGYVWQDLEADATVGLLTDSDFGGGGTDGKGHIFKGSYAIAKNWNASFTYFINEIDSNLGTKRDYDRLQLDMNFKY